MFYSYSTMKNILKVSLYSQVIFIFFFTLMNKTYLVVECFIRSWFNSELCFMYLLNLDTNCKKCLIALGMFHCLYSWGICSLRNSLAISMSDWVNIWFLEYKVLGKEVTCWLGSPWRKDKAEGNSHKNDSK